MSNHDLAKRAAAHAQLSPPGSPGRQAGLCLAVCLGTTSSLAAARRALADIGQDDLRAAAAVLLEVIEKDSAAELPDDRTAPQETAGSAGDQ